MFEKMTSLNSIPKIVKAIKKDEDKINVCNKKLVLVNQMVLILKYLKIK
jgi:hypothetical protein